MAGAYLKCKRCEKEAWDEQTQGFKDDLCPDCLNCDPLDVDVRCKTGHTAECMITLGGKEVAVKIMDVHIRSQSQVTATAELFLRNLDLRRVKATLYVTVDDVRYRLVRDDDVRPLPVEKVETYVDVDDLSQEAQEAYHAFVVEAGINSGERVPVEVGEVGDDSELWSNVGEKAEVIYDDLRSHGFQDGQVVNLVKDW